MPAIRVTYNENSLTAEQKAELATLLIDAVMQQEVDPITEAARHITAVVFNEVPQHNSFGAQSFWLVEAMIAAGFLNQARRDAAQVAIGKAFVKVLGDDGSSIELGQNSVSRLPGTPRRADDRDPRGQLGSGGTHLVLARNRPGDRYRQAPRALVRAATEQLQTVGFAALLNTQHGAPAPNASRTSKHASCQGITTAASKKHNRIKPPKIRKENQTMITDPFQKKAYDAVAAALPFAIDPAKITVEPGVSYLPSPIKQHDYAAGMMAAFGSVVEHLGRVRGLPAQTMTLNRRLAGFHLNELQTQFLNGYPLVLDTW